MVSGSQKSAEVLSGREIVKAEAGGMIVAPPLLAYAFAAERGNRADILIIITPGSRTI